MEKIMPSGGFLLLDGNAMVHRAYHALPPLTSQRDGTPTGAIYGFFSMLFKLLQDIKPSFIAATFDLPKPTFRKSLYVGYQAQRPKMTDDLSYQIDIIHDILNRAHISIFEVSGFEADDVIGTIAKKVSDQKQHVVIVSGDRDLLQLVNSHVKILFPIVGITKMAFYDGQFVEKKFGITPSQIIDYKAFIGDSSDNYTGVPGVGPKTALKLLQQYKTFDQVYRNIQNIEKDNPDLARKLAEYQEEAQLAKKLATIVTDVPFIFNSSKCSSQHIDDVGLRNKFQSLGFNSLLKRMASVFPPKTSQLGLLD